MRHILTLGFVLFLSTLTVQAQETRSESKLEALWIEKMGNGEKLQKLKDEKILQRKLSIPAQFAVAVIEFNANQSNDKNIRTKIKQFETLTPSMRDELEKSYPGILKRYEGIAKSMDLSLYLFTKEPVDPIGFKDLEAKSGERVPDSADQRIRYYNILIQRELFKAGNLSIEKINQLRFYIERSLTSQQRDKLVFDGYEDFWYDQKGCYESKYSPDKRHWACTCGSPEPSSFPSDESPCGWKELSFSQTKVKLDRPTVLLKRLTDGDLSAIQECKESGYGTPSAVQKDIIKELIFLYLVGANETTINSQTRMKINLVQLWEQGKSAGTNEYLDSLGFNDTEIAALQEHYECLVGLRTAAATNIAPQDVHTRTDSLPTNRTAENRMASKAKAVTTTETISRRKISYTAENLDKAVSENLTEELSNRVELQHTCVTPRAVNDSTYEVLIKACADSSDQIFPVGKDSSAAITSYCFYASNVVASELSKVPELLKMRYSILVTATSDVIPYRDNSRNQALADQRAKKIANDLGPKAKAGATKIESLGQTGLPVGQRYVILTFFLSTRK